MTKPHICPYCGLNTHPLAYHESYKDCQARMRRFIKRLRTTLTLFAPFPSAWELKDFNDLGDKLYEELQVELGTEKDAEHVLPD